MLYQKGVQCQYQKQLWKLKILMKVRIFVWLLLNDKLLTREILTRRGCVVHIECVTCVADILEIRDYLFWQCQLAKRFWRGLLASVNLTVLTNTTSVRDAWWHRKVLHGETRKRWDEIWASGVWEPWKERNRRIFTLESKQVYMLINKVKIQAITWGGNC